MAITIERSGIRRSVAIEVAGGSDRAIATEDQAKAGENNSVILSPLRAMNLIGYATDAFYMVNADVGGAVGAGNATIDTAAFAAAIASGKRVLEVPGLVLLINPSVARQLPADTMLVGRHAQKSVLKLNADQASHEMLRLANGCVVGNIKFDFNEKSGNNLAHIIGHLVSDVRIDACEMVGMDKFAIAFNGAADCKISDVRITKATPATTQNEALLISSSAGLSARIYATNIRCIHTGINVSGEDIEVVNSSFYDWRFGGGVTFEQDAYTKRGLVQGCQFDGAAFTGLDVNSTPPPAVEMWSPGGRIVGNQARRIGGPGYEGGGNRQTIEGNLAIDCGYRSTVSGVYEYGAISMRWNSPEVENTNGGYSLVDGNSAYNTDGATGPMAYGYVEQDGAIQHVKIGVNQFRNLRAGGAPYWVSSAKTTFPLGVLRGKEGPLDFGTIAAGASSSFIATTAVGARVGDFVAVRCSVALGDGISLHGRVASSNLIYFWLFNASGSSYDPPPATYYVEVARANHFDDV